MEENDENQHKEQSVAVSVANFMETSEKFDDDENQDVILRDAKSDEATQIDQDKVKANLINLEFQMSTASNVLKTKDISSDDNLTLFQITIKVRAVHIYKWIVYHTAKETLSNIKTIYKEIENSIIEISTETREYFEKLKSMNETNITVNINDVEKLYKRLFINPHTKNILQFKEFFQIGIGSFNQYNNGNKPLEGYVKKQEEPYCLKNILIFAGKFIQCLSYQYNKRWIVVKDDSIYYSIDSNSEQGRDTYFFEDDTIINRMSKKKLSVKTSGKELILKFNTYFEREYWYMEICKRAEKLKSLIEHNIYGSFTNEKKRNQAHWFSDGKDYFLDLKENLLNAKETIFITDWWMSPEVFLERPVKVEQYEAMAFHQQLKKENPPFTRLMDVLGYVASKGVKIYILVYSECSLALTLQSKHTQDALEKVHENIKVTRHPDAFLTKDIFWSHHEKLVIIDQKVAYVGGLDLCWGRWDTHEHVLVDENKDRCYNFPGIDYSNARIADFNKVEDYLFDSVPRKEKLRMPWHDVHTRLIGPVVSDIARHFVQRWNFSRARDQAITDIKQNDSTKKQHRGGVRMKDTYNEFHDENSGDFEVKIISKNKENEKKENDKKEDEKKEEKKDEVVIKKKEKTSIKKKDKKKNEEEKKEEKEEKKEEEKVEEKKEDEKKEEKKDEVVIKKKEKTSIKKKDKMKKGKTKLRGRRPNKTTEKESNENNEEEEDDEDDNEEDEKEDNNIINTSSNKPEVNYADLRKKFLENKVVIDENHLYQPLKPDCNTKKTRLRGSKKSSSNTNNNNNNQIEIETADDSISKNIQDTFDSYVEQSKNFMKQFYHQESKLIQNCAPQNFFGKGTESKVQVLRSVCEWSAGVNKVENSILKAYYRLIDDSKYYIYIENQFFVSKSYDNNENNLGENNVSSVVKNEIAYHIRKRIERAYIQKEKFRVFIFLPLLPGFAGEPDDGTIQIILLHTYAGICRNHGLSIIEQLENIMGDEWKNYIGFYSLRGHAVLNGKPMTELIYIHSKLMIVDDEAVIIGSANINDRSMLGSRDSEFCVLIKETAKFDSVMNGEKYKSAKYAVTFRKALMAEHLGINVDNEILVDPLNDELNELFKKKANNNTKVYRELFGCYPDDEYKTIQDVKKGVKAIPNEGKELEEFKEKYEEEKKKIDGHIVEFPLHFLENEQLGVSFWSIYNYIPEINFT